MGVDLKDVSPGQDDGIPGWVLAFLAGVVVGAVGCWAMGFGAVVLGAIGCLALVR